MNSKTIDILNNLYILGVNDITIEVVTSMLMEIFFKIFEFHNTQMSAPTY